jgi:uncharacterized membrane protein YjjP (DUF1212 family)
MIFKVITVFFIFLGFYFLVEKLKFKFRIDPEYTRKIAHIVSGLGAIFFSGILNKGEFIFLTFVFFILFFASYKYNFLKSIHLRKRKSYGEICTP